MQVSLFLSALINIPLYKGSKLYMKDKSRPQLKVIITKLHTNSY